MSENGKKFCADCKTGYHSPYERFEFIIGADGGGLLYRCKNCKTFWDVGLHDADPISASEAIARFPGAKL